MSEESNTSFFQAIGVVKCEIDFTTTEDNRKITLIDIRGKKYPLLTKPRNLKALKIVVKKHGNSQSLVVYPLVTHFPARETSHTVRFQLVAFGDHPLLSLLNDLEFQLSGFWQFIPVCRTPCVTVQKNFTDDRLQRVKNSDVIKSANFLKASHIPLLWKDALVSPFRFNPKITEDQGKPLFISVKARFLPSRDLFSFDSLVTMPNEKAPRYLKLKADHKAKALKARKYLKFKGKHSLPVKKQDLVIKLTNKV